MIQRAPQFSPNSVEKDKAILDAVAKRLLARGYQVESIVEGESCLPIADAVFTMGRLPDTLAALKQLQGIKIINSSRGIENCARRHLETIMEQIAQRDYADMNREVAPLRQAEDAVVVDTSELNLEESIEAVYQVIREKLGEEL